MNKKIYLTESELRSVIKRVIEEQAAGVVPWGILPNGKSAGTLLSGEDMDSHTRNTILSIGLGMAGGPVGILLAAGISLYDAKMYYDEGEKYTAGLIGMFSLIPLVGGLANKLGLTKWTGRQLVELGKKIGLGGRLSKTEVEAVKKITQNRELIEREIKKYADITLRQAKEKVRRTAQWQAIKKIPGWTVKNIVAPTVAYDVGYNQAFKNDIKVKVENQGLDWDEVKNVFGSSGTKKDNELLTKAWDNGWRPGMDIPENLKTPSSKVERENDVANLEKLKEKLK